MRSVTSSIVGPWDGVSWPGPLRATLPMEVVTVFIYVMPVISSLMMQLMLMVAIPGAVTTPMVNGLGDTSGVLSSDTSLFRHAITLRELQVSVTGQTTSSQHTGKKGFDGVGAFCWVVRVLDGSAWGTSTTCSSLSLEHLDGWGICPAATTGHDGCKTFSHPRNLGALFSMAGSSVTLMTAPPLGVLSGVIPVLWGIASLTRAADISSRRANPLNTSSSEKER